MSRSVRSGPVESGAPGTEVKLVLCLEGEGRHSAPGLLLVDWCQWRVAARAASEGGLRLASYELQYLRQLSAKARFLNKKAGWSSPGGQAAIPGEQQATLRHCQAHQSVVVQPCIVDGVITEDAQPLGECAEHSIDEKGYIAHQQAPVNSSPGHLTRHALGGQASARRRD